MRKGIIVATLAGALLVVGTPRGVIAQGDAGPGYTPRCGYTHYCSEGSGDTGSSDDPERYWNCRYDPYRDDDSYRTPCRYSEECTNYPRCKD